jgi:hypothetical protein
MAQQHISLGSVANDGTGDPLRTAGQKIEDMMTEIYGILAGLGTASTKNTGTSSGNVPVLDGSGLLSTSVLPPLAITDVSIVASQSAMLALTAQKGDVAIRSDLNKSFVLSTNSPSTLADWKELLTPTDTVLSVAGLTGAISASSLLAAIGAVDKNGDTMTGPLTLHGDPTSALQAATKQYVDGGGGVAGVGSFNGRTGVVVPAQGDYPASLIPGTATNDNATAGNIGQYVESNILLASSVTGFVTGTPKNVTSISLPAGDWDVTGNVASNPTGGAVQSSFIAWISTSSATLPDFAFTAFNSLTQPANLGINQTVPKRRMSLATTTTIYLTMQANFSGGAMAAYGTIQARRIR